VGRLLPLLAAVGRVLLSLVRLRLEVVLPVVVVVLFAPRPHPHVFSVVSWDTSLRTVPAKRTDLYLFMSHLLPFLVPVWRSRMEKMQITRIVGMMDATRALPGVQYTFYLLIRFRACAVGGPDACFLVLSFLLYSLPLRVLVLLLCYRLKNKKSKLLEVSLILSVFLKCSL
jgi:hypothetical protein